MFTAYVIVTLLAAAASAFSAVNHFTRPQWIVDNMNNYGVPVNWLPPLGVLKAAGVVGLLVGFAVPVIGAAAAIGLVLFYLGAITVIVRARWWSDIVKPVPFLVLAAGSLVLLLAVRS